MNRNKFDWFGMNFNPKLLPGYSLVPIQKSSLITTLPHVDKFIFPKLIELICTILAEMK